LKKSSVSKLTSSFFAFSYFTSVVGKVFPRPKRPPPLLPKFDDDPLLNYTNFGSEGKTGDVFFSSEAVLFLKLPNISSFPLEVANVNVVAFYYYAIG
jgi:hypothetical protein